MTRPGTRSKPGHNENMISCTSGKNSSGAGLLPRSSIALERPPRLAGTHVWQGNGRPSGSLCRERPARCIFSRGRLTWRTPASVQMPPTLCGRTAILLLWTVRPPQRQSRLNRTFFAPVQSQGSARTADQSREAEKMQLGLPFSFRTIRCAKDWRNLRAPPSLLGTLPKFHHSGRGRG